MTPPLEPSLRWRKDYLPLLINNGYMAKAPPSAAELMATNVESLLSQWPATAQVFISYRMACVGCDFAKYHTTQEALEAYSLEQSIILNELAASMGNLMGKSDNSEKEN